jgi:U-box domain
MEIPSEFVCPITMEIMVHPLVTRYGQNFERSAIVEWLEQGSGECPLTRKPLKMSDLIHNNYLATKIHLWCKANGVPHEGSDRTDDESSDDNGFDVAAHIYGNGNFPFSAVMGPSPPRPPISPTSSPTSVRSLFSALRSPISPRRGRSVNRPTLRLPRFQAPLHEEAV